jgi:arylsulfatase A
VAATYDIFATAIALAGAALPADRIIDGRDLTPLFANASAEVRREDDCIFIYKGTPHVHCPKSHPQCPGLWAIRCGMVKMHYVTSNWSHSGVQTFHDPPLAFHLGHDPGESYPLDAGDPIYVRARPIIDAAKQQHLATLVAVPNQMAKGVDPRLKICKDPHSQTKHPSYPNCTSNPEYFAPGFVCTSIGVREAVSVASAGATVRRRAEPLFDLSDARTWPHQARIMRQDA